MRSRASTGRETGGPIRTCLGCGVKRLKKELIRVVAEGHEGQIAIDEKGRLPGRGAYCCPDEKCLGDFIKKRGRVARALRCATVECDGILDMAKAMKGIRIKY